MTVFEDYPKFMDVVEHVHLFEEGRMRWAAFFDEDVVEWDADTFIEHIPEERITWHALDGRETGQVRFEKIDAGSTRVHYQLEYDPATWHGKADTVRHWMRRRVKSIPRPSSRSSRPSPDAALQGRGLGGQLMEHCLRIVDASHRPAYLEAPNPHTIPFCERHGFEVVGVAQAGARR